MPDAPTPPDATSEAPERKGHEHSSDDMGHGHSSAAWTAVGVILLGSLIMSVAVVVAQLWLFVVGAAVVVVGVVLGKVLSAMGFGQKPTQNDPAGIT